MKSFINATSENQKLFLQKIECFWSGLYDKVTLGLHNKFTKMYREGIELQDPDNR